MTHVDTTKFPPRLILVLLTALVLRAAAAFVFDPPMISDDRDYHRIAQSIVRGDGFAIEGSPTAYRPPGYPILLAGVYWLFGESGIAVRLVQAMIDVVVCLLTYLLGKRLLNERFALSAAWIYALLPSTILYTTVRMSETVFTALLLLYLVSLSDDAHDIRRFIVSGVIAGCAALMRTTAILLPLVIVFLPAFHGGPLLSKAKPFAITAAFMVLILFPWMARNESVFDRFALTSNDGVNFWMGNHSGASGSYSFPPGNPLESVIDDFERSDLGYRLGMEFWMDNPGSALLLTGRKLAHFFSADYWMALVQTTTGEWRPPDRAVTEFRTLPLPLLAALQIPFMLIMLLALPGSVFLKPEQRRYWNPVIVVCVLWIAAHLVIYAGARYRFPLTPLLIVAAAQGWQFLSRDRPAQVTAVQVLVLSLLTLLLLGGWVAEAWILFGADTP